MTTYDDTTAAALLDAGAVLPLGATTREDADTLTVRTYTHPALDDRRVVRLVPGTLGAAEDLALDFLGLTREPEAPEAGQVRKETLGFPAWALVNDPANGHHALALVQDVERLARQAWSRPGAAKDGFEELGERLGRAVPHFLPTFYEEAARVFLQQKNTAYAAAFFGKAREAERVHALAVDEERQRAVFLEFAFAGALTVKALKDYVKDLALRLEPAAAWAQFRQLTVERCAAGMAPYASLPQDARALLRAAGLNRVTEECALLAELIDSPAVVRAPASFWTAYRPTLTVLAEHEPAVRARLLEIMPSGLGRGTEHDEFWLALLTETGADLLLAGQERAGQDVDAADWLSRWAVHRKYGSALAERSEATLNLVARMAPRLRADGRPVDLFSGRWYSGAELDLLDLCAAEGVPLTMPQSGTAQLPLDRWLNDTRPGRRDLAAVAADPRLRPLLHRALDDLGHRTTPKLLTGLAALPALRDVLRDWLDERAAEFTRSAGLPGARTALTRMRVFRPVAAQVNAAAVARVAAHEIAPLVGRTLRAGIADELGWPALDEALRRLDTETKPGENTSLTVTEAWPALILSRRHKAVVVGPDEVLLEHDLRLPCTPGDHRHPHLRYADGELLVVWRDGNGQSGYWSSRPAHVFTVGGEKVPWYGGGSVTTPSVPLPGGGRATGGRTLHAGDTVLPPSRTVLGDGTGYWRQGKQGRRQVWLEYDPATGAHGRASLPGFLAAAVREDATLVQDHCEVLPLQPGLENSPFGTDGTVLGRWVRREGEEHGGATTCGTPDGRTVVLARDREHRHGVPLGALRLPGGAGPVAVLVGRQIVLFTPGDTSAAGELGRVTPGDAGGGFAAGTVLVPPLAFWHALRPRDERASAVLRELTDERVAEVLEAAAAALAERRAKLAAAEATGGEGTDQQIVPPAQEVARRAVARAIPELTDERIRSGVAALMEEALRLMTSAAEFVAPPAPSTAADGADRRRTHGMFADYSPPHGDDHTLREATTGLAPHAGWWGGGQQWNALRQIRAVNQVLSGQPADGKPLPARDRQAPLGDGWVSDEFTVPAISMRWPPTLAVLRPLVYRAAAPDVPEAEREALLLLFEAIAEGPLAAPEGGLREIVLSEPYTKQERTGQVLRRAGRTVVVLGRQGYAAARERVSWLALDHDPSGAFGATAHFTLESETRHTAAFPAGGLAAVTRLIRDKGAAPWRPDAPTALTTATDGGVGPAQAALLLIGRPHQPGAAELATIGLKPRQRDLADGLLGALDPQDRAALVGALLPADPADLWAAGPDTAAAGRVWAERLGSLVRLPEDVAASLTGVSAASAEAVLNPARTPWLSRTTVQRPDKDGSLVAEDPAAVPSRSGLTHAVEALAALAYTLPHGHPLRAALPAGLEALRRRMADPELLLDLDLEWSDRSRSTASELRTAYGLPATGGADDRGNTHVGDAIVLRHWYGDMETVLLRPAALTGPDDAVFGLLEGIVGPARSGGLRALRAVFGKDLEGALAVGGATGFTGHAQDPSRSVPDLVAEVVAAHGLGEDAAALYLMLLALPDPTDRDCARWTGWKPARMKKARTELAASGLVVEARRARAGRSLFLPCGWLDLKAPALPVELWKRDLYPVHDRTRTVPPLPVPELFARAWDRVRSGDAPAYEELTTSATRKGRSKR